MDLFASIATDWWIGGRINPRKMFSRCLKKIRLNPEGHLSNQNSIKNWNGSLLQEFTNKDCWQDLIDIKFMCFGYIPVTYVSMFNLPQMNLSWSTN